MPKFYNTEFFFAICESLEKCLSWISTSIVIVWKGKTTLSRRIGMGKESFSQTPHWEYKRPHEFPLTKLSEDHSLIGGEHSLIVEAPFWNTLALESPIFRFVYSEEILRTSSWQGWLNKCPCHSVSDLWIE